VLARLSGDEFALLLPATNRDQAERVAGQLLTVIRTHTTALGSERAQVTASVGIALFDGVGDTELMALADAAMYAAKESGRDRFVVFDPDERRPVSPRAGEAGRLRRALRDRRFVLHCQPIWSLAERRVAQYELLIRMRGDADELIPPNAFLYAAERFGLVGAIDSWVVSQAVDLIAAQAERGNRVVLAVNLSGRSVGDPAVAEHIDRCLERSGVDPSCLVFELTETAAISNIDSAVDLAQRLHRHGCGLALDDFGAGFASFSYLKNLPFDYIKIDGDFVRGLAESATDRLLIDAIVTMARGMGRRTIAEFVADGTTSDLLEASGVDYAQGFHIGRPAPVGAVLDALGDPGGPTPSGGRRR
jgi:EAL domain-containing protein (putative c-di-GMP-specific phosphodiesterase class I)